MKKLQKSGKINSGTIYAPCDIKSPYGGVFFYGIHSVEMALNAFGFDVSRVLMTKNKDNATGQLLYKDGKIVTMNFHKHNWTFAISAHTENGLVASDIKMDANNSIGGIKIFTKMFKTGIEPIEHHEMMMPVKILEALQRSQKTKTIERI